jgi:hypothetical protein
LVGKAIEVSGEIGVVLSVVKKLGRPTRHVVQFDGSGKVRTMQLAKRAGGQGEHFYAAGEQSNAQLLSAQASEQEEAILTTLTTAPLHNRSSYETRAESSATQQVTRALVLERLRNGIDFAVDFEEIQYREVLGCGSGGCVNAATYYGANVAVKTLYIKRHPGAGKVSLLLAARTPGRLCA